MAINRYHLVKVLDGKWADSLLDGGLYFRALQCFGDLGSRTAESNNSYRGDSLEGINMTNGDGFGLIDALTYREKLYCMYALDYDENRGCFIKPYKEMIEFGNTAVVIYNVPEFLRRICKAMIDRFDYEFWAAYGKVSYIVDFQKRQIYNEFCKSKEYAYQNEFRVALDLANGRFHPSILERTTDFARLTFPGKIEVDENPDSLSDSLTLNVGSIRDISMRISTNDLVNNDDFLMHLPIPEQVESMIPPREPKPTFFFVGMKLP